MIKLGLIGAGRWGRNYIRTMGALDGVFLSRLASRNPESAAIVPPGCIISSDWRELICDQSLDGVIIATPPTTHAEIALAAVAARLPSLIEKPLCMTAIDARNLQAEAVRRKVLVMVDHTHLFNPAFEELLRQLPALGSMHEILAEAGNYGPVRRDVPVVWDWGPHDVAMCLATVGRMPRAVVAERKSIRTPEVSAGETVNLLLDFDDDMIARVRLCNWTAKVRRFQVRCAHGEAVYDDLAPNKLVVTRSPGIGADYNEEAVPVSSELPLTRVVKAFIRAIQDGMPQHPSLKLGVDVVEVLQQCAGSIKAL